MSDQVTQQVLVEFLGLFHASLDKAIKDTIKGFKGLASEQKKVNEEMSKAAKTTSNQAAAHGKMGKETEKVVESKKRYSKIMKELSLDFKSNEAGLKSVRSAMLHYSAGVRQGHHSVDIAKKKTTEYMSALLGTNSVLMASNKSWGSWAKTVDFKTLKDAENNKQIRLTKDGIQLLNAEAGRAIGLNNAQVKALQNAGMTQELYTRKLKEAKLIGGDYLKSFEKMAHAHGKSDKSMTTWSRALEQANKGLDNFRVRADSSVGITKKMVDGISHASVANGILNGHLKASGGSFKIFNENGLKALGLTAEQASKMKMLASTYGAYGTTLQRMSHNQDANLKSFISLTKTYGKGDAVVKQVNNALRETDKIIGSQVLQQQNKLNASVAAGTMTRKEADTALMQYRNSLDKVSIASKILDKQQADIAYGARKFGADVIKAAQYGEKYKAALTWGETKHGGMDTKAFKDFSAALNLTEKAIVRMGKQMNAAGKNGDAFVATANRQKLATNVLNERLNVYNNTLGNSYKYLKPVTEQSGSLANALDKLGTSMMNVAKYAVGAFAFYGAMSVISTITNQILSFDQSLKDLHAITTATDHQVTLFGETIKDVSRKTKFSASEIAEGMKNLGQAGFSAAETMVVIDSAATLATGTLSDMTLVVDLLTTTIRAYHLEASESGRLTDLFANAINRSKLTVDKLRVAFNYLASVADKANISVDDSVTLMGMLANAGVRASTIGTSLRQVVEGLVSPNKAFKDAVEAAGYSVDQFIVNEANPLEDVIRRLQKVVPDAAAAFELFGIRGAPAISAITTHGVEGFIKMRDSMQEAGSAQKMAEIQMEGLANKAKNMKDRFELAAIALGDAGLKGALNSLIEVGRSFATLLEGFFSSALGTVIVHVVGLGVAVGTLNLAIKSFLGLAWIQGLSGVGAAASSAAVGVGLLSKAVVFLRGALLSLVTTPLGLLAVGVAAATALVSFQRLNKEEKNHLVAAEKKKALLEKEINLNDKKKNAANALANTVKDTTKTETQRSLALERLISLGVEVTGVIRDEAGAITNLDDVLRSSEPAVKAYVDQLDRLSETNRADQLVTDVEAFMKAEEEFSAVIAKQREVQDRRIQITMDFAMTGSDPTAYLEGIDQDVLDLENQVEATGQKLNEQLGKWFSLDQQAYKLMLTRSGMAEDDANKASANFDKLDSHFFRLWTNQLRNMKKFSKEADDAFDEFMRRMDQAQEAYTNSPETRLRKIQQDTQTAINDLKKKLPDLDAPGKPKNLEFFMDALKKTKGVVEEVTDKNKEAIKSTEDLAGLPVEVMKDSVNAFEQSTENTAKAVEDLTGKAVAGIIKFQQLETEAAKIELDNRLVALRLANAQKVGNEHDTANAIIGIQRQQIALEIKGKQAALALMRAETGNDTENILKLQNEITALTIDMAGLRAEEISNIEAKASEERKRAEEIRTFEHNMKLAEIDATYWEDKNLKERATRDAVIANLNAEMSILNAHIEEKKRKGQEVFDEEQRMRDLTLERQKELYAKDTEALLAEKELRKQLEQAELDNLSNRAELTQDPELQMEALRTKHEIERKQWEEHYKNLLDDKTLYLQLMKQLDIKQQAERDALIRAQQAAEYSKKAEFFGELSGMMGEFYAISNEKAIAFFYAQKALAVAEILMNTHAGAAKALGMGPFGIPMSALIMAMGYAKAGMVMGLTVAQGVKGFADGGEITGYSPNSRADNIPINATAGEFMQPVASVDYYGKGVMEAMRTRSIPRDVLASYAKSGAKSGGSRFADGGGIDAPAGSGKDNESSQNFHIVNVLDPGMFEQYMSSHAGQKTLMNIISKNPQVIKNIVRN